MYLRTTSIASAGNGSVTNCEKNFQFLACSTARPGGGGIPRKCRPSFPTGPRRRACRSKDRAPAGSSPPPASPTAGRDRRIWAILCDFEQGSEAAVGQRGQPLACVEDALQVLEAIPLRLEKGDLFKRAHLIGKGRDDPEVAIPRPAQRPEQIRVVVRSTLITLARSAPDVTTISAAIRLSQAMPEVAGEEAQAAAERRTGQAYGALRSCRHREVLLRERGHRLPLAESGADGHGPGCGIELSGLQLADVDDDAVVDVRPALKAVTAAADPQRDAVWRAQESALSTSCVSWAKTMTSG